MKEFTVTAPTNLKDFTDATYPQGSFVFSRLLKNGDIRVNGVRKKSNCPLNMGDIITFYTTSAQEEKPSHTVIYEDENVYVADKLSGVASEGLFFEISDRAPYPVHRLDRNTSGLIVVAKSERVQSALVQSFKDRTVEKIYLCFAAANFKAERGVLTAYQQKNAETGKVRVYDSPAADRVKIVTEYAVEKIYGDYALVKVVLHTGKTHQIRAHLAHIGCPVLGDNKYGDEKLNKKYSAARQILIAKSLRFNLSGELEYLNELKLTSKFFPVLPESRS